MELIENEKLSFGHAKVLVGLTNAEFLAKKIANKNLSVRQTEALVKSLRSKNLTNFAKKDANISTLEKSLRDQIGIKCFYKK